MSEQKTAVSSKYQYTVPSVEFQTGWKRRPLTSICQDHEALGKINSFNFDLHNREFIQYFVSRTGIKIDVNLDRLLFFLTNPESETFLMTSFNYKHEKSGVTVSFHTNQRKGAVNSFRILKARLQDCWELFAGLKNLLVPGVEIKPMPRMKGVSNE